MGARKTAVAGALLRITLKEGRSSKQSTKKCRRKVYLPRRLVLEGCSLSLETMEVDPETSH